MCNPQDTQMWVTLEGGKYHIFSPISSTPWMEKQVCSIYPDTKLFTLLLNPKLKLFEKELNVLQWSISKEGVCLETGLNTVSDLMV